MMNKINPTNDIESLNQQRNRTTNQKKNADATKEGVVVNSFIKDNGVNMDEICDTMVISSYTKMPSKLYEDKNTQEKRLLPLSLISIGVMSSVALISFLAKRSAKINLNINKTQKLPALTRNISVNEETHQAIYQMIQSPNQKTILAGMGVITISAMAFMGKMFIDGFKEVWVKKKEADIQKNLQEKLIAVETQSFSGKIQILRNMLSEKAKEFNEYLSLNETNEVSFKKKLEEKITSFKGNSKQKEKNNTNYIALGVFTLGSIIGLGYLSFKNLQKGKSLIEQNIGLVKSAIGERIAKSKAPDDNEKQILKNLMTSINADENYIRNNLSKLNWKPIEKENFINDVIFEAKKSTVTVEKAMGGDGTPKPAFYSHVNDYRAFFYNMLLDKDNKLFQNLFFGITGISALSYGGKVLGEGVKEVQVKKMNAETELDLQKRLVSTELRNFKAKKDAAIDPLCEEFYNQLKRGKPKQELKTIAENILAEVKNGPPFVYS